MFLNLSVAHLRAFLLLLSVIFCTHSAFASKSKCSTVTAPQYSWYSSVNHEVGSYHVPNEFAALQSILSRVLDWGGSADGGRQAYLTRVIINYDQAARNAFLSAENDLIKVSKGHISKGIERAQKVYELDKKGEAKINKRHKPSYRLRLEKFMSVDNSGNIVEVDQLQSIVDKLVSEPRAMNATFTLANPSDIQDAFRNGYCPCLQGGHFFVDSDKKFVFVANFRTMDVLTMAYSDIKQMVLLQEEIYLRISAASEKLEKNLFSKVKLGSIVMNIDRSLIPRQRRSSNITSLEARKLSADIAKFSGEMASKFTR